MKANRGPGGRKCRYERILKASSMNVVSFEWVNGGD
jgi:hypothetical protein